MTGDDNSEAFIVRNWEVETFSALLICAEEADARMIIHPFHVI